MLADSAIVSFRTPRRDREEKPWSSVGSAELAAAVPWRTFRWYRGQKHYSGTYWSATMRDHVIYESRLELSRLLLDDFDQAVHRILAQPFLLKTQANGKVRKHIPDYLLITAHGPEVIDVKPRHRLARPEVAFTFEWTRQAVEARGWKYTVWSEPEPVVLENVRFLAGYRRDWLFDDALLEQARTLAASGGTLGEIIKSASSQDPAAIRACVLHLLWNGDLVTDLTVPLGPDHRLRGAQ
ncbi:TnsA-like heteromeric transposase endonuclease subunit [Streptomyces canus]|uniref:TnsA-like heteromeric transposase endonuclease subunit n=1 Tax=Streptomyces canus TaxID=58343 RepID=UPI0036CFBFC9